MTYLLVLLTLIFCIGAHLAVRFVTARKQRRSPLPAASPPDRLPGLRAEEFAVPAGVFLDTGHTWVELDPTGMTRIGVDDFVRKTIGRIDSVTLPGLGEEVHRGEELFSFRQGERVAAFSAPIDGVVDSVNEPLEVSAAAVASEPYGGGWVCTLRPANLARDLRLLLVAAESLSWIRKEFRRFQAFLATRPTRSEALGDLLPDGGQPTRGILEKVDAGTWDRFVAEFLQRRTG